MKKLSFLGFKTFLIIAHLYFVAANIPLLTLLARTPPGTVFPLYHAKHIYDYNVYLSAINQGANGSFLMKDTFTSEATNPTIFYIYYVILGKVTSPLHLWPPVVYHVGRIISFELFLIGLYLLNTVILGKKLAFWASFFAIIGTIAPIPLFNQTGAFTSYTPWWREMEAVRRLDALPHYLLGYALLTFSVTLIFLYLKKFRLKYLILCLITVFIGGIIFPPSLLPIIFSLPASFALFNLAKYLKEKKWQFNVISLIPIGIILATAVLSLLLIWRENYNGFPWNTWNKWEIAKWNVNEPNFNRSLFLSLGILPILAIPAVVLAIRSANLSYIFLSLWAYLPLLLLPFIDLLGVSKMRLATTAPFIPLSMLTAITIFQSFAWRKLGQIGLIILLLITTYPVTFDMLKRDVKAAQTQPYYTNIFIPSTNFQAIEFIKNNVPKNSVILSNEFMGIILPAYTPVVSFFAHSVHTKDFYHKQDLVWHFYANRMTAEEAKNFLNRYKISYVYFGPDEAIGENKLEYPFLTVVFQTDNVTIFTL